MAAKQNILSEDELREIHRRWCEGEPMRAISRDIWEGRFASWQSCQVSISRNFKRRGLARPERKLPSPRSKSEPPVEEKPPEPKPERVVLGVQVERVGDRIVMTNELRAALRFEINNRARIKAKRTIRIDQSLARGPDGRASKTISDEELRQAHSDYIDKTLSLVEAASRFSDRYGNLLGAVHAVRMGWQRLGLKARTPSETWAARRDLTRQPPSA